MADLKKKIMGGRFSPYVWGMASGMVASLALPPINMLLAILILSVPALMLGRSTSSRQALILGWATGFGWFFVSLYWVSNSLIIQGGWYLLLIPLAGLGFPLLFSFYWGVGFWLCYVLARAIKLSPSLRLLLWVIVLVVMEYLRGVLMTGFPWNAPGLIAAGYDLGLAMASIVGYWGMTLLVLAGGIVPALLIVKARVLAVMTLAVIIGLGGAGHQHRSQPLEDGAASGMQIRLVQPNIPQGDKWKENLRDGHLGALVKASRQSSEVEHLDLIVWPESAFAGAYDREQELFKATMQAASSGKTPILTGLLRVDENPFALFNAAMLAGVDGEPLGSVGKSHLVPFGEYAPFRDYLPFVDAIAGPIDFSQGQGEPILTLSRQDGSYVRLMVLICYEVIFPAALQEKINQADVMVNLTNDGWFGDTLGPRQHLAMAQMRSAELGRPLIRAANTGISAIINSYGQVTHRIDYGEAGVVDGDIGGEIPTLYRRYGDAIFWGLILFGLVVIMTLHGLTPRQSQE